MKHKEAERVIKIGIGRHRHGDHPDATLVRIVDLDDSPYDRPWCQEAIAALKARKPETAEMADAIVDEIMDARLEAENKAGAARLLDDLDEKEKAEQETDAILDGPPPELPQPIVPPEPQRFEVETGWAEKRALEDAVCNLLMLRSKSLARMTGSFSPADLREAADLLMAVAMGTCFWSDGNLALADSSAAMNAGDHGMTSSATCILILGRPGLPGTVNAALVGYYDHTSFKALGETTQQSRRAILERLIRTEHGDKRTHMMHAQALQTIMGKLKPNAQRNFKKAMRGFIGYCLSLGLMKVDPLAGIELAKAPKSKGFHAWTDDEVEQYRKHHAAGTKARLALEVILQTGHARSDVVRIGDQRVKGGRLTMARQKTGTEFSIPLLPELVAELALHRRDGAFP